MATEKASLLDQSIPQWKRDLILRRRAVGRVLPTGSGSVQLTCPSVVAAVRFADYSVNSDFLRRCESEREQTGEYNNMRLVEQVNATDDSVEPCVILDIKGLITKIESGSNKESKMGEEKNLKKVNNSSIVCEKKLADDDINDNASDSSEEFKYGPGIVSKLKSKYLSLTLRESQGRTRSTLDGFRRATSLENILDAPENEKIGEYKLNYLKNVNIQPNSNRNAPQRCRGHSRVSKESMKRARSVEVLTRCDQRNSSPNRRSLDENLRNENDVSKERKKTRKLIGSSNVEETELPPPDLVKLTLKIFEKSSYKTPPNVKSKNQKNISKSVCDRKPSLVKQNSVEKTDKLDNNCVNDNVSKNKISDKKLKNADNSIESITSEKTGTVEKRKVSLFKETNEPMINKKNVFNCNQEVVDGSSNLQPKSGLSLDLTDSTYSNINRQKASPLITSPKISSETSDLPEPKRCISPVLVRAPPCILSSELNFNSSSSHHTKQVGVIRPIVTNKTVCSNLSKPITKTHLTEREIEKNLINKVKSIEQPVTKVIVSLKKSPEECLVGSESSNGNDVKSAPFWDKTPNTMVFNFCNRKTIPDYIENDGLILAPRKEKPKVEAGVLFLGGNTEDSSTDPDFDPDEVFSEPPLSCNIIFEGENILINGKSNIQSKPKLRKMKIQFNDEATTLFEYPSEASLLDDPEGSVLEPETLSLLDSSTGSPNPFRYGHLASYTPSKVPMATNFELGVTKTTPPPPLPSKKGEKKEEGVDEENYLRPADEGSTVSWNCETAADLLF